MNTDRPLDGVASIKVKLGLLVGASVVVASVVAGVGDGGRGAVVDQRAGHRRRRPRRDPVAGPRDDLAAARDDRRRPADGRGRLRQRVTATSSDEVGTLAARSTPWPPTSPPPTSSGASSSRPSPTSCAPRSPPSGPCSRTSSTASCAPTTTPCARALPRPSGSAPWSPTCSTSPASTPAPPRSRSPTCASATCCARPSPRPASAGARCGSPRAQPADLPCVADPARLAQLVANLVDNAVRHSPPQGEVRVSARAVDDDRGGSRSRDDGPGIPADRVERVFDRFGSGDDSGGGTGLGLAIARWVCELHGGTITRAAHRPRTSRRALRAVLPRRARAGRPTHLARRTATVTTPTTPTTTPRRPRPASPVAPRRRPPRRRRTTGSAAPAAPAPVPAAALLDSALARAGRARPQPLAGARGARRRRLGRAHLARAQRRPRGRLTLLAAGAAHVASSPATAATRGPSRCAVLAALLASTTDAARRRGVVAARRPRRGRRRRRRALTLARTLLVRAAERRRLAAVRRCAACRCSGAPSPRRARSRSSGRCCARSAFSLVALALFGGLFASGDAVFGSWAEALVPDLGWDTIVPAPSCSSWSPASRSPAPTSRSTRRRSRTSRCPRGVAPPTRWEWAVPVGVVVALFAAFLVAQAAAMWGGHEYLQRTTGLTYAEYVHQGFGQLTAATFLTLVVVGARRCAAPPRDAARDRLLLRRAPRRPVRAHPRRRRQRPLPDVALPGGLRLHGAARLRRRLRAVAGAGRRVPARRRGRGCRGWWLPRAVLVSAAVFALGFAAMNPDAWVASATSTGTRPARPSTRRTCRR